MLGAATVGLGGQIADQFIEQGPVGVLALIIGWFGWQQLKIERARGDRERDRADAERARADEKDAKFAGALERVLPLMAESTRATQDLLEYTRRDLR